MCRCRNRTARTPWWRLWRTGARSIGRRNRAPRVAARSTGQPPGMSCVPSACRCRGSRKGAESGSLGCSRERCGAPTSRQAVLLCAYLLGHQRDLHEEFRDFRSRNLADHVFDRESHESMPVSYHGDICVIPMVRRSRPSATYSIEPVVADSRGNGWLYTRFDRVVVLSPNCCSLFVLAEQTLGEKRSRKNSLNVWLENEILHPEYM